jgi:hypothetical protein
MALWDDALKLLDDCWLHILNGRPQNNLFYHLHIVYCGSLIFTTRALTGTDAQVFLDTGCNELTKAWEKIKETSASIKEGVEVIAPGSEGGIGVISIINPAGEVGNVILNTQKAEVWKAQAGNLLQGFLKELNRRTISCFEQVTDRCAAVIRLACRKIPETQAKRLKMRFIDLVKKSGNGQECQRAEMFRCCLMQAAESSWIRHS